MKARAAISLAALVLFAVSPLPAQDAPQMPKPTKEHEWLRRIAGEWDYEVQVFMNPGAEPFKATGTEKARMIGGFWVVGESTGAMGDMPFTNITTFGYDPETKKYVGTGIDSMSSTLWRYVGTMDATGKILNFETEGPCPMRGGKMTKFRGITEFKSDDHRVFTSSFQEEDGKWVVNAIVDSRRKE